jgi:hypothetical protein
MGEDCFITASESRCDPELRNRKRTEDSQGKCGSKGLPEGERRSVAP